METSSEQLLPNVASAGLDILITDDEPNIRRMLTVCLTTDGHRVVAVGNVTDALSAASHQSFDLALLDLRIGTETGLDLIPKLLAQSPWLKVVVITAYASIDTAVEAIRRGASDYLPKPFTPAQVRLVVNRVAEVRALEQRVASLQSNSDDGTTQLESRSPVMRRALSLAQEVAPSEATVLIRGESGTGKGVLARAIHGWSQRSSKPFAVISCPALSPQLLESELFGHVRGAFTGAVRDNPGRIAATSDGTLFLDEIGDLPLSLQPKLLRFVQDREYERVGDSVTRRANVRVITATNVDLAQAVNSGRFREDLLYRINVIQIDLPPLRDRSDDLQPLAETFLRVFGRSRGIEGFTKEALAAMRSYPWPGNVRELRNVVERSAILCRGKQIGIEHLPGGFTLTALSPKIGDHISLEAVKEHHIRRVLATTASLEEAATILGIDTATLYRSRKKYGM